MRLVIGNGASLEKVDKFCHLGDMLDADGGCDSAVTARVRSAWKKLCKYLPILIGKGFSLKLKGKVYATCVRSLSVLLDKRALPNRTPTSSADDAVVRR